MDGLPSCNVLRFYRWPMQGSLISVSEDGDLPLLMLVYYRGCSLQFWPFCFFDKNGMFDWRMHSGYMPTSYHKIGKMIYGYSQFIGTMMTNTWNSEKQQAKNVPFHMDIGMLSHDAINRQAGGCDLETARMVFDPVQI